MAMREPRRPTEEPTVDTVTEDEIATAVQTALGQLDLTMDELQRQGRSGRFSSTRARLLWAAVHDLAPSS
jgi:hypothetical protein